MRKDVEEADRRDEVRTAARAWHRAGAIDRAAMEATLSHYGDDRSRVGTAFRVLLFFFTLLAGGAAFGLLAVSDVPTGGLLFLMAFACIAPKSRSERCGGRARARRKRRRSSRSCSRTRRSSGRPTRWAEGSPGVSCSW